jgi:hypothetical protein
MESAPFQSVRPLFLGATCGLLVPTSNGLVPTEGHQGRSTTTSNGVHSLGNGLALSFIHAKLVEDFWHCLSNADPLRSRGHFKSAATRCQALLDVPLSMCGHDMLLEAMLHAVQFRVRVQQSRRYR